MFEGLEGLENLRNPTESRPEGLTDMQKEYIWELNIENEDWAERDEIGQFNVLNTIDGRMEELGVPLEQRAEVGFSALSSDLADAYEDFLVEQYDGFEEINLEKQLECPNDNVQIEQVREVISCCEEIKYENWIELELPEKEMVLNNLEEQIAEIEHRPACPIHLAELGDRQWGGYNPETKDITINSQYAELSDFDTYREVIDTLVHEGRHAYQDYNVNVAEIHPRHSEVQSWAETMEGGKWGYWGDCSSLLGQRLYEQQSIEIDARNFASDVMNQLDLTA